jgi:hypothetical protein
MGPTKHRHRRAKDGEHKRDCKHGDVRPGGKSRPRSGQGITDPSAVGDGNPRRPHGRFHKAVYSDQLDGSSERDAQDRVLDQPRDGRPGDFTDKDRQRGGAYGVAPHHSGNPRPNVGIRGVQCLGPIDLLARRPTLHQSERAKAGKTVTHASTSEAAAASAAASP